MNSIHSDSVANDLLDALSAKLSSVSGHRGDLFRSVNTGPKLRSTSKPTLEDVTDRCVIIIDGVVCGVRCVVELKGEYRRVEILF